MSETKQKSSWFTSCLGKLVFWLWLVVIGAVGGVWLGINLERMYPGLRVPGVPLVKSGGEIPFIAHQTQVRTGSGLIFSVSKTTRAAEKLDVYFSIMNDGIAPVELGYDDLYLLDGLNHRYDKTSLNKDIDGLLYMLSFFDPLNPGVSQDYRLTFKVPDDVAYFDLYYGEAKVGRVQ